MADTPPVLPPPPAGGPGALKGWEDTLGEILHGFNPGGIFGQGPPASLPVPKSAGGTGAQEPARTGVPSGQTAPEGGPLSGAFWERLKQDLEVYGFLFLLVGIGLYGLFAPQLNAVVQTAAAVAVRRK